MSANPLSKVLALLRLLKEGPGINASPQTHIENWIGPASPGQITRIAAYVQEVVTNAIEYVEATGLPDDARLGLLETLKGLEAAFTPSNFASSISSFVRAVDASISSFSILSAAAGVRTSARPNEVDELVEDVQKMIKAVKASQLDSDLKAITVRHLNALLLFLKRIDVFGADGATAAYAEMVVRLQSVAKATSEPSRMDFGKIWPAIERWAGRLTIIEGLIESGQSLIGHAQNIVARLPGYTA